MTEQQPQPQPTQPDPTQQQPQQPAERHPQAPAQPGEMIGATGDHAQDQGNQALQKDPSEWVTGDDPMTPAQKSYLDNLAKQAGEQLPADLTKAEASEQIDRLRDETGTPPRQA